ncbi:MAG TPA: bifunctional diaminohydroxyphosphoribosylaminopyrimidine deaminase/5-amino-6-(5-phosphoribosylamino)uracil reductase RibD [Mycobacteriales bacterium]|nr:bifunctional diaminohydroxyphosphoribosylaminopyrimidine deaminase/5-amino-6-(5-phosphoribosylamino)uracil reductase RibD [Mycobacteriales bacterium]
MAGAREASPRQASPAELAALRRALDLGRAALGRTSPNPPVGCVVLDPAGQPVGEGHTRPPGDAHAEVVALRQAGRRARGGTAVVTLEPCDHTGRTGPCTRALVAAGIARVVYAVPDPNPLAGGGADTLRAAGVEVLAGPLRPEAERGALEAWLASVRLGRPFVTWKYAATLDGRVAAADRSSRWVTSPQARADVHRLRAEVDAVVAGSGTVLADDPALTVRDPDGRLADRQPLRVVLDRRGRVPRTARVFDDAAPTLLLDAPEPAAALAELGGRGVVSVLVEGGPTLAGGFVAAGCVDRVVCYLAPALLGTGPPALGAAGVTTIAGALRLRLDDVTPLGPDLRLTARPLADPTRRD